nr:rep protein [Cressdnaviricota sp.]UOF83105.1 rep protein [Cressdnaviricota sp.]
MTLTNVKKPILSPESITVNTSYTFTLNPCDDLQYFDQIDRIKSLEGYAINYILPVVPAIVDIYMEVSRAGRLHFHGTINFPTIAHIKDFYVNVIHKLSKKFQIEIDTICDPDKWREYCTKSSHLINVHLVTNKNLLKKLNKQVVVNYIPIN